MSASANSRARPPDDFPGMADSYRAIGQELELEFVPVKNFRVEMGTTFASHDIAGVPGLEDRRQLSWQGVSVDLRYRFLDRDTAPFGLTVAVENHADRVDETTAAVVRSYGTEFTLAFDRELIPNVAVAALNLSYQPEWTRVVGTGSRGAGIHHRRRARRDGASCVRVSCSAVKRATCGDMKGSVWKNSRVRRLFVGPTAYFQLSRALAADGWPGAFRPGAGRPDRMPLSISSISSATRRGWCSASISRGVGVPGLGFSWCCNFAQPVS